MKGFKDREHFFFTLSVETTPESLLGSLQFALLHSLVGIQNLLLKDRLGAKPRFSRLPAVEGEFSSVFTCMQIGRCEPCDDM